MEQTNLNSWITALQLLKEGNARYIDAQKSSGDISAQLRLSTFRNGQKPYAIILSCSDSRVMPESIFSANLGDLFVIRVAGNVIDSATLASIEYALSSLGTQLVVVMGHTGCGAVKSAIRGGATNNVKFITDKIRLAIRDEQDDCAACRLNVDACVNEVVQPLSTNYPTAKIMGAIYHTDSGKVQFFE